MTYTRLKKRADKVSGPAIKHIDMLLRHLTWEDLDNESLDAICWLAAEAETRTISRKKGKTAWDRAKHCLAKKTDVREYLRYVCIKNNNLCATNGEIMMIEPCIEKDSLYFTSGLAMDSGDLFREYPDFNAILNTLNKQPRELFDINQYEIHTAPDQKLYVYGDRFAFSEKYIALAVAYGATHIKCSGILGLIEYPEGQIVIGTYKI